ncbi:hypothetical protein llap_20198 [Limosa lapponica baueri]|uniref:Ig-like domain-containing protein n=1 Tax=Limosa lapponica baueri TaxID=1758121 RepID=A0A2I0T6U6_LIMLA|nr:hypothetical protein llap_20198 [Limosa lapponica baueri]
MWREGNSCRYLGPEYQILRVPPFVEGGDELLDYIVILHSPLELDCSATGTPSPTITWLKDGQPVEEGAGHKILLNGQKLLISRAQVSDTGHYKCVAANKAGEHEREFDVTVHEPPSLEDAGTMLNETVVVNNPIHLECRASGNPLPAITWYKDNRPLTSSASATFLNRGQVLQIEGAQISDTGIYKCVAANTAGTAELFYSLQVHVIWKALQLLGFTLDDFKARSR